MSDMQDLPSDHPVFDSPPDEPAPSSISVPQWRGILTGNKSGPFNNIDNVICALETDPNLRGRIWYDEFLDAIITNWEGKERKWRDVDDVLLQFYMQRSVGLYRISVGAAHDAALVVAFRHVKNECKTYLETREWDNAPYLNHVMHEAFGASDTPYSAAVGRCWFISMAARVIRPGCKVDTVPVLEGAQGVGKSTALSIIGGKWFVECHESVLTKDFFGVLDGHMLVEIAEMHSFTRSEVERVKGLISCQVDRYRKAYGRNTEDHPRQTVLACTTNRDDWQRDETGARRFWPILCGAINLEWLKANRDQLFAEAVHLFKAGATWWDVPQDAQEWEVEQRRDVDSWEDAIAQHLVGLERVTTTELLGSALKIDISKHDQFAQKRVGRIMRVLGWRAHVLRESGRNKRYWVKVL